MSFNKIYVFIFSFLLIIILFNINGIIFLFTGIDGATSIIILILSLYLLVAFTKIRFSRLAKTYVIFYFTYTLIGIISLIFSNQLGPKATQTVFDIIKTVLLVLSTYTGFVYLFESNGNKIIQVVAWSIILSVLCSYLFYLLGISDNITRYRTDTRLSGIFANPNELSAQALFSMIFVNYLLINIKNRKLTRYFLLIFMLISFIVLLQSFSRIVMLTFALVFIMNYFKFTKINIKTLLIVVLVIIVSTYFLINYYDSLDISAQRRMDTIIQLINGDIQDDNTGGRIELYKHGMELILNKPFFGNGLGIMQHMDGIGGVHNAYLAIWGNSGFFVLFFFILFILIFLRKLFQYAKQNNDPTYFFLILTIVLNGITKTGVFEFKINNLIFALCLAILTVDKNNLFTHNENSLRNR